MSTQGRVTQTALETYLWGAATLLRGTIDQVDEVAHITWVQPKVLDMKQIGNMRQRLLDWNSSVNQLGNWIEGAGQDVWAA